MKKTLLVLSLLAGMPFAASAADGISYNYVEGGYATTRLDNGPDADGWGLNGSVAIAPNFHIFGGYTAQDYDQSDYSYDQWRVGFGYNREISRNIDLVGRAAFERLSEDDYRVAGIRYRGADFDGYSAEVGIRGSILPQLEGYAFAGWEDGSDYDGDFYGRLGAQYKFTSNWGINADVKFADNDAQWFVGPRFTW